MALDTSARLIPLSAWDTVRVAITRRLCRCDEIECRHCTRPWRPRNERTKAELIDELADSDEQLQKLRTEWQDARGKLEAISMITRPDCKTVEVTMLEPN